MENRALIIGAGISGLSAAYYLNKAGFRATIVEKSPSLGGVIHTEEIQGCLLEAGPDSFIAAKPWALELIRDVGLADQVINSNDHLRVTYVLRKGKLIPLPDGMMMMVPTKKWPLITTRLLSWPCKIRMGLELFRKATGPREDRSVADFLLDHYGQEAIDYLAEPLLSGVFGGDPKLLSVDSVLTRFVEIEAKYGSLSRGVLQTPKPQGAGSGGSLFRTLKGGLGTLIDKLAPAADVVHGEAEAIERTPAGYRVRVGGSWMETEQIFIGAPAYVAARLLLPFDGALADLLNSIPYNSSMTLSLGYDKRTFDHPLRGFGFLVPKRERQHLKACTWVNNKFDFRAADDKILLRCFFGGDSFRESDESIVEIAQQEVSTIMGFKAKPVFYKLARWRESMAQYTVGHKRRVDRIKSLMGRLPGIAIGGSGYNGIGIPDCIRSGKEAAKSMAEKLTSAAVTQAAAR
jgi:oxygen-dependent protoporphyrinogen oxidase